MRSLSINKASRNVIEAHALGTFPNECCGFFFGTKTADSVEVVKAYVVKNVKEGDQRRRFEIDPLDYIKAERYALELGIELLGVYHSHPLHPAIPSEHDLAVALPEFSYIIVSVENDVIADFRSWRLDDAHQFTEEKVFSSEHSIKQ